MSKVYKRIEKSTTTVISQDIRKVVLEGKKVYWDKLACEGTGVEKY